MFKPSCNQKFVPSSNDWPSLYTVYIVHPNSFRMTVPLMEKGWSYNIQDTLTLASSHPLCDGPFNRVVWKHAIAQQCLLQLKLVNFLIHTVYTVYRDSYCIYTVEILEGSASWFPSRLQWYYWYLLTVYTVHILTSCGGNAVFKSQFTTQKCQHFTFYMKKQKTIEYVSFFISCTVLKICINLQS